MPICTVDSLATGAACFMNFGTESRKSILIYFSALELAAIGGTDYSAQLGGSGTLMTDATCLLNLNIETYIPPLEYLVIAFNNAVAAGAAPVSTPAALGAVIACNANFSPAQHDAQLLWLTCQLGFHASDQD